MAEALSLAASVIAVVDITAKVTGASIKLVNLWKEIKNVPDALLEKAERLKDFEDFLLETEIQAINSPIPQQAWNSALLQKYIARTRTVLKDLQENVDRLHTQVTDPRRFKRKLASTRTVLRKEDLSVLDSRLDVALELFKLAREQYLTSLMAYSVMVQLQQASESKSIQMPQTKVAMLTEAEESASDYSPGENSLNGNVASISRSFVATSPVTSSFSHKPTMIGRLRLSWRSNCGFQVHAQPPSWLMGSVYSLLAQRSLWGWQLSLRAYEVVECLGKELHDKIERDDVLEVFKHLDDRKMSPFVRNQHGNTLLELAFIFGSFKLVQALLDCGLGAVVLEIAVGTSYPWALELLQLPIFDEDDIDDVSSALIEMSRYGLDDFLEGPEAFDYSLEPGNDQISFRILLKYAGCHRYQSFSFEKRLQHFRALVMFGDQLSSRELRLLLPETESLTIAILESSRMDYRFSLFRSLAIGMVYQAMDRLDGFEPESGSGIAWYRLLGTILELDPASLHHLEKLPYVLYDKSQTAFSQLVSMIPGWARDLHSLTGARKEAYYRRIHRGMDAWLDALLSNQVDLLSYGRRERGLNEGGHSIIQQKWVSFSSHPDPPIRLRLHGITFGPSKEHWRFWWADEYEEYAGDFWAMIKDKEFEMRIPGSWEDEYDAAGRYYPEWNRLWDWEAEEPLPLIWSEYRKAQMPM